MASRFTALPLSTGESFVLETDHGGRRWVILFDGGQTKGIGPKKNQMFRLLQEHCPEIRDRIDIAVCSHSDHDHSGGFPDFVATWTSEGNEIGEFWLPALWSPALPDVLINPDRLIANLKDGAGRAAAQVILESDPARTMTAEPDRGLQRRTDFQSIEQILRDNSMSPLTDRLLRRSGDFKPLSVAKEGSSRKSQVARSLGLDLAALEIIQRNLEESHSLTVPLGERASQRWVDEVYLVPDDTHRSLFRTHAFSAETQQLRHTLAASVIETAEAIQSIATVAASNEILIRWFDFGLFERGEVPRGGLPGLLRPINTVEIEDVVRETDSLKLFFSLKLTEQNVSSLVFQREEENAEPSVIFVADSRLAFGVDRPEANFPPHLVVPKNPVIFTAAHHASRNNDRAYEVLKDWLGAALFQNSFAVRNGGVHNQTLADFLNVQNRRCAQCYQCHDGEWSQLIRIETEDGKWNWPPDQGGKCGTPKKKKKR